MPLQDLGQITTLQKMIGIKMVARDVNENEVFSFNGLQVSAVPANIVTLSNVQQAPDLPAGSAFTFDAEAIGPLGGPTGQVTITCVGQQGNFQPLFTTSFTLEVIPDPSTPGPPTHWTGTPGTIAQK